MTFPSRTTSLAATAAAAVSSAVAYPFLPKQVATHFDPEGEPDRHGSRVSVALTLPAMMAGLELVNDRLGTWPGGRDREDRASGVQAREEAIGLVELALLSSHLAVLAKGVGFPVDMDRLNRGASGVLTIGLGNLLPKLPRNGLVGIRTPWTLADPGVWERTHRLGGYLVTAAGLVTLASLPAPSRQAKRLPLVALLAAIGLSSVYSYVAYARRAGSSR
jgi:uncharacterized membrane protein